MSTWRMAGLNYVNYSNISAKVLRQSLKTPLKDEAMRRDQSSIKFTFWVNGAPTSVNAAPPAGIEVAKTGKK